MPKTIQSKCDGIVFRERHIRKDNLYLYASVLDIFHNLDMSFQFETFAHFVCCQIVGLDLRHQYPRDQFTWEIWQFYFNEINIPLSVRVCSLFFLL